MTREKKLRVVMQVACLLAIVAVILEKYIPANLSNWIAGIMFAIAIPVSIVWRKERKKTQLS